MEIFSNIIYYLTIITFFIMLFVAIYYSIILKFPQFHFKKLFSSLNNNSNNKNNNNSNKKQSKRKIASLMISLAAKIGVGTISGIGVAIYEGGIGTIFWIWLMTLIILPNSFVESSLAVKYREKDLDYNKGGPAYYIKKGLNLKKIGILYAIILTSSYVFGFIPIQANTISSFLTNNVTYRLIIGIILGIFSLIVVSRGLKGISEFVNMCVPIMGIMYMLIALFIIIKNYSMLPSIFISIIKDAFTIKTTFWGLLTGTIILGMQKSIFSSECGLGTSAIASGTSQENNLLKEGYRQMFGVYFTIFIVCSATSIILLTSKVNINNYINPNGVELIKEALIEHFGPTGNILLFLTILSFAFSTVIAGYYYSESNIKYIFKNCNNTILWILRIVFTILIIYGSYASPNIIWKIVELFLALLALINILSIFGLRKSMKDIYLERSKK